MRSVMILAAGRGNRLRPITDSLPKPLVEVQGKPLIVHHLLKLAACGVQRVVINHAWLGEVLVEHLGDGQAFGLQIHYSAEPPGGLETAGGILQALPLLTQNFSHNDPFMVINGDIWTDYDFTNLLNHPLTDAQAHLVLVPTPQDKQAGDFGLNAAGLVVAEGNWTFSGISLLRPELFKNHPEGGSKLAPLLRKAMQINAVSGEIYTGVWSDIGTPERLAAANEVEYKRNEWHKDK